MLSCNSRCLKQTMSIKYGEANSCVETCMVGWTMVFFRSSLKRNSKRAAKRTQRKQRKGSCINVCMGSKGVRRTPSRKSSMPWQGHPHSVNNNLLKFFKIKSYTFPVKSSMHLRLMLKKSELIVKSRLRASSSIMAPSAVVIYQLNQFIPLFRHRPIIPYVGVFFFGGGGVMYIGGHQLKLQKDNNRGKWAPRACWALWWSPFRCACASRGLGQSLYLSDFLPS